MKKILINVSLLILLFIFSGATCSSPYYRNSNNDSYSNPIKISQNGSEAQITVNSSYNFIKQKKCIVLPFKEEGKTRSANGYDSTISGKFALHLMEIGFTVIDSDQVFSLLKQDGWSENTSISKIQIEKLRKEYGVDLIVKGVCNYRYIPGRTVGVGSSGQAFVGSAFGTAYSSPGFVNSVEGVDGLVSESVSFISTKTGEIVISVFCNPLNPDKYETVSMSKEIALAIGSKLQPINGEKVNSVFKVKATYELTEPKETAAIKSDDSIAVPSSRPKEDYIIEKKEPTNSDTKWKIAVHIGYTTAVMDDFNDAVADQITKIKEGYLIIDPLSVSAHERTPMNGSFYISADLGFSPISGLFVGPKIGLLYCSLTTFIITSQFYGYGQQIITTETFDTTLVSLMGGGAYSFILPDTSTVIGVAAYAGYGMSNATMNLAMNDGTMSQTVDIPIGGEAFVAEFSGNVAFTVSTDVLFKLSLGYRIAQVPYMLFTRDVSNSFFGMDKVENEVFQMYGETIAFDYSGFILSGGIEYNF